MQVHRLDPCFRAVFRCPTNPAALSCAINFLQKARGETMHVRTVRKPGDPGTLKLVEKYGDRLVNVRYRDDPVKRKRYKTVELIVAEEDWQPPAETSDEIAPPAPEPRTTPRVPLRIQYFEKDLQQQVKAIGGIWHAGEKLWYAPEAHVQRIGLENRIVR